MKFKIVFVFVLTIFFACKAKSQDKKDKYADQLIKIYSVSWNTKYRIAKTVKNIKSEYAFYFETDGLDFSKMFLDFNDCREKLSNQKSLADSLNPKIINSLVEFHFDKKHYVSICFDMRGNYYYEGKWHVKNNELYYLLFKYFSDEIVPLKTLQETKSNFKDDFWHNKE